MIVLFCLEWDGTIQTSACTSMQRKNRQSLTLVRFPDAIGMKHHSHI